MIIEGNVEKIIYSKEEFVIGIFLANDGKRTKFIGKIDEARQGDISGLSFVLEGKYETSKYGKQFRVEKSTLKENPMRFFLLKVVKGLGERTVDEILNTFPNVEEVFENSPQKLLKIKGIGKKRYEKIIKSYAKYKPIKELSKFLLPYNMSASMVVNIYNHFSESTTDIISLIKDNPYVLTEVRGIGFPTADRIALELGININSYPRYEKAIEYVLQQALSEGHTYLLKEDLIRRMQELGLDNLSLIEEALLLSFDIQTEDDIVYMYKIKEIETSIINQLLKLNSEKVFSLSQEKVKQFIKEYEEEEDIVLSEKQEEAVLEVSKGYRLFCLSGYAGTGKTTTMKAVMSLLSSVYKKHEIIGCAFTGIASNRLRKITGFNAKTVHSLLEWNKEGFGYNKNNKLPYKVILLDEATMVDIFLLNSLLNAIDESSILIMVGDPAQLPPISAGNIFSDILLYDIRKVQLDKIFRQKNDAVITLFANSIRKGKVPKGYLNRYSDFHFYIENLPESYYKREKEERAKILEASNLSILNKVKETTRRLKENKKINNIISDFQVLSPMRMGILGTENLNKEIQSILNPQNKPFIEKGETIFKEGDKVMHINQNLDMEALDKKDKKRVIKVNNGQIGIIEKVDVEEEELFVRYGNFIVRYEHKDLKEILNLAYAITIHKSQGSEFKNVILVSTISHWRMLTNQILYTGMTRAKQNLYVIGHKFAFEKACKTLSINKRNTFARKYLNENTKGLTF